MRCPFCKTPVARKGVHECPRCGLSHAKVTRMFGAPPQILPGITDPTGELSLLQRRAIRRGIARIKTRFPQVSVAVFITGGLDPQTSLNTYTFWIFNNANVCPNLEKGGLNHTVLLVVDTSNARASLTVGYGLESFLDESHLRAILESAKSDFLEKSAGAAIRAILASLNAVLGAVHRQIDRTPAAPPPSAPSPLPRKPETADATF